MRIIVTGATGLVGSEVARTFKGLGDDVLGFSRADLDIRNAAAVGDLLVNSNTDAVINCAAYTDVDAAESNPEDCFEVNAAAVGMLARACSKANARFVTISTDYVFDGRKDGFYSEMDTPRPLSVYARAKLAGEKEAIKRNEASVVVRTGWIFGRGGTNFLSVIPRLLREGKKIKTISDAFGTPTFARDLALRLRDLVRVECAGLFHVTNAGGGTSYTGFARKTAEVGGFDSALIEEIGARELERAAPRPENSRLACEAVRSIGLPELPHWHDAIERHLKK